MRTQQKICSRCKESEPQPGQAYCQPCKTQVQREYRERTKPKRTIEQRLLAQLEERPDGCLVWTGSCDSGGYGQIGYEGKNIRVHILYQRLFRGGTPAGRELDHFCHDGQLRTCVMHTEPVTHAENIRRGYRRKKFPAPVLACA